MLVLKKDNNNQICICVSVVSIRTLIDKVCCVSILFKNLVSKPSLVP